MKVLYWMSAVVWGTIGLLFGAGPMFFGAQHFDKPGGLLALLVGASIAGCAYLLHRLTRSVLNRPKKQTT
ncbi:hypothetical protein [Variovorax sp. GT1P44]|uniref:hypothetical protein n=1 Tax=Variovorax sp. GT1P44 TaxID=3443742 RepID=UPI003F45F108